MNAELLEIQPQDLKFIFEFQKQSSCFIRLANKSDHHVAFKVKTTSAKKYCVRPNTGVIKPNKTSVLTVTMQAQNEMPSDFISKDKFLVLSTVVPKGTKEDHIISTTFCKDDGKHVEEKKLNVVLVSPPSSPVLSPMNEISRIRPYNASMESNDDFVQRYSSYVKVDEGVGVSKRSSVRVDAMKNEGSLTTTRKHTEELRLSNDVEEMKLKLRELESLLTQEKLRNNQNTRTKGQIGFQLLFVFVVGLVGLFLGYLMNKY